MAVVDISGISYFLPIVSFLIVFVIIYALLAKTKILGESMAIQLFISFLLAAVFISAAAPRNYVQSVIPWFVVVLISLFILLAIVGFVGKPIEPMQKGVGIAFVIVMALLLIGAAFFAFSDYFSPYLPGASEEGANPTLLSLTNWLYSSRVAGALLLIVAGAIVSWVLVKTK